MTGGGSAGAIGPEHGETMVRQLAAFTVAASWGMLSDVAKETLKLRVIDAVGCAIGALGSQLLKSVGAEVREMGGRPLCTLLGGGRTAPDRAAFFNGAAVRYLDFNDSYLAPGETCHPSDNLQHRVYEQSSTSPPTTRWYRLCSNCRAHRMSADPRDRIYTISRDATVSVPRSTHSHPVGRTGLSPTDIG